MQTAGKEEAGWGGGGEGGPGRVALELLLHEHRPPDAPTAKGKSAASPISVTTDVLALQLMENSWRRKRREERKVGGGLVTRPELREGEADPQTLSTGPSKSLTESSVCKSTLAYVKKPPPQGWGRGSVGTCHTLHSLKHLLSS